FINIAPIALDEVEGQGSVIRLVETMMSLNPQQRFQTPTQLLDAVREVRREVEGKKTSGPASTPTTRSVFVVEKDERLQDAIRTKFKEVGYRVLLAADPVRALDRFRQQPFDALVLDAGTTGEDGMLIFKRILEDADRLGVACAGIVILSEEQAGWAAT